MHEERDKRLVQLKQAFEDGSLEEDTYRALVAMLGEDQASSRATVEGAGAAAQGGGTAAGAGGTAIGKVEGNVYVGPAPKDPAQALAIYRRVVAQTSGQLPLRGVDVGASDPTAGHKPLGLANVYVDLDTTAQVDSASPNKKGARGPAELREHETRPLAALEAVIANRHLALLGDPGGGKSTLLNHLAYCLAMQALEPDNRWLDHLPGWPLPEASNLPIVAILRDFARQLPEQLPRAEPSHLWDFLVSRLAAQNLGFAAQPIADALESGRAFVLLDGLDEVPTEAQRVFVRDAVTAFVERYRPSRFLVTCRVLSYQEPAAPDAPDLRLAALPYFELAQFDEDRIDRFIARWYDELAHLGVVRPQDKDGLAQQLQSAVRRPDLWRLAPNPLLLTVMALVHTHKGRLPDARALLYEETIDILLWRWEQVKVGGPKDTPRLRQLLLDANRTEVDLKRVLWQLAYEAHGQSGAADDDKLADIGELRLQKALATLNSGDLNWAQQLIEAMKLRAGLLIERAPEVFTFPHRTFQEYLAGVHLASLAGLAREASKLAEQGPLWRVAILMAVGRLVYLAGDTDKPLALVGELCTAKLSDTAASWRKVWLAGDALLEIGTNRIIDGALGRDLLERVQSRLVQLLAGGKLSPRERAAAGNTLARLGDPRFDTESWYLPAAYLFGFVFIPPGKFHMGSDPQQDTDVYEDEQPPHEVTLPGYWMARWPVTVAQFRAFIAARGHEVDAEGALMAPDNHPVTDVSWHDAQAYCRWLDEQLKALAPGRLASEPQDEMSRALWAGLASGALGVGLPSEAEWERAARGTDARIYPWGGEADPERANYRDTGLNDTTALGCFPGGVSPAGCEDMSGNVYEWTRSLWGKDVAKPDFHYPYNPDDRRCEDLSAPDSVLRVLRGGAFFNDAGGVRCAVRGSNGPDLRDDDIGFRVVVSPFFSER